jgi:hypothetical protein
MPWSLSFFKELGVRERVLGVRLLLPIFNVENDVGAYRASFHRIDCFESTKSPYKSTLYLQSHIEWIREWKKSNTNPEKSIIQSTVVPGTVGRPMKLRITVKKTGKLRLKQSL